VIMPTTSGIPPPLTSTFAGRSA